MNDTLRLIRLLDGDLSADEGAELREQLATDESLRNQWQQLHAALATSTTIETWSEIDPFAEAEHIAFAVEQSAIHGEDESTLGLADHSSLREVAVLDRWLREPADEMEHVTQNARDRMAGVILRHVQPVRQSRPVERRSSESRQRTRTPQSRRPVQNSSRPASRRNRSQQQLSKGWVVGAVAGLLLTVTLAGWHWFARSGTPGDLQNPHAGELVEQDGGHEPQPSPNIHDDGVLEVIPDDEIVHVPRDVAPQSPRDVMPVEDDTTQVPPTIVAVAPHADPLIWQQVVGLIVASDAETGEWGGVWSMAKGGQPSSVGEFTSTRYRSLPQSWGRATTAAGIDFTMSAETIASLGVVVGEETTVDLLLEQGQLAIRGLNRNAILHSEWSAFAIDGRSLADGGQLAWEADADSVTLHILAGEFAIGDEVHVAPAALQWNATGGTHSMSPIEHLAWLDPPAEVFDDQEWLNSCLTEADIIAALLNDEAATPLETQTIAAAWSMQLDPQTAVPLAAVSNRSTYREAAVAWLRSPQQDDQQLASVWHNLRPALADTELDLPHWFRVAQGASPATPAVLQEMALGVGVNQPLFVRHSAIHFLRLATGQRFANYDAESPTQQAIAEVRNFVRQFTRPNPRQRQRQRGSSR